MYGLTYKKNKMTELTDSEENIKLKYLIKALKSDVSKLSFTIGEKDSEIEELKYDIKKLVQSNNNLSGIGGGEFKVVKGKLTTKNTKKEERLRIRSEAKNNFKENNDRLTIIMNLKKEIEILKNSI